VEGFDHAKTRYPLTGAHARVECKACHANARVSTARDSTGAFLAQWKPLAFAECSACHSDPHEGRFGAECAKCHVSSNFHTIDRATFDHERTRYPLRGEHTRVACSGCHDAKRAFGKKPKFGACRDCHADAHAGTAFATSAMGAPLRGQPIRSGSCEACHTVDGFRPSTFSVARHDSTAYPLTGRHRETRCEGCHPKGPVVPRVEEALGSARVLLHPKAGACTDCHADPHAGRMTDRDRRRPASGRAVTDACLECHSVEGFRPARVDAAVHAAFAFPLEGAHRAVPCLTCHKELATPPSASSIVGSTSLRPLRFEIPQRGCRDCHENPHGNQFEARPDGGACEGCHGLDAFSPAGRFDHERDASFRLEGAHARTPCASCHPKRTTGSGDARVVYRPISGKCESCHADDPNILKKGQGGAR
jgi:hypothetical protein